MNLILKILRIQEVKTGELNGTKVSFQSLMVYLIFFLLMYLDPTQSDETMAYGIEIQNVEENDHGLWMVQVSLEQVANEVSYEFNITVAHMPEAVEIGNSQQICCLSFSVAKQL